MDKGVRMDEELKRRFAPKRLKKEIPGQRLFPTRQGRSFEYLEPVSPRKFEFVYHFGGFSGVLLQKPPDGFAWIKSFGSPLFWQVRKQDLDGKLLGT
jgi:hypothetical protein